MQGILNKNSSQATEKKKIEIMGMPLLAFLGVATVILGAAVRGYLPSGI
ncbi:hypothetical protein GNF79_19145, partial [Clostridium perfringens]|nr:hypothetical protein [Clostridium perfringens]